MMKEGEKKKERKKEREQWLEESSNESGMECEEKGRDGVKCLADHLEEWLRVEHLSPSFLHDHGAADVSKHERR
jgi:hypothetical protein